MISSRTLAAFQWRHCLTSCGRSLNTDRLCIRCFLTCRQHNGDKQYGSPVWNDVDEMSKDAAELPGWYQIFGHTQQEFDPIICEHFACLDCRRAFRLTDDGKIEDVELALKTVTSQGLTAEILNDEIKLMREEKRKSFDETTYIMSQPDLVDAIQQGDKDILDANYEIVNIDEL